MKRLESIIYSKLSEDLQQEWLNCNKFVNDCGLSALPDGFYKGAKKLDYGEMRKLRDEWDKSAKNEQ